MARETKRPLLAIALMLCANVAFVAMQAVVKSARQSGMHTMEVMFYRTAPGLPVLYWVLRRRGHSLKPEEPADVLIRSLLGSLAMGTNFAAMLWLSLAQFSTLNLLQPVFVALAAPLVLREPLRVHVWSALPLALAGALVLIVPGVETREIALGAAFLGLSSALFSAFAQMWVRKATASEPPDRVVFHFAAFVSVLALIIGVPRGDFQALPSSESLAVRLLEIAGMAGFGTLGQALMTRAYSLGEAASVSMIAYASILLSMGADLLWWRQSPTLSALFGALLVVLAGVVLVRGERRALPVAIR